MPGERVLVTGGAGFIGSHVVDMLLAAGFDPAVVDDLSSGRADNLPAGVPLYQVDVRDAGALAAVFAEVRPERVCHLAAQMSVSRSVREPAFDAAVNVMGMLHLLEQCVRSGVRRMVFASSGGTLYGDVAAPVREDAPLRPISPYGIAKLAGEHYLEFFCRQHGLEGVSLRYANVYGPRQDPHGEAGVVAIFTRRLLRGEAPVIFGDGGNVRDYVYVQDVARANLRALAVRLDQPCVAVNIGTGAGTDVSTLERQIRAALAAVVGERRAGELPAAVHAPPRPGDLRSSLLHPGKAAALLGWEPNWQLAAGLGETVAWFAATEAGRNARPGGVRAPGA